MRSAAVALVLACALPAAAAAAAPGDLDRSFGVRGVAPGDGFSSVAPARMAIAPGGRPFVLYRNFAQCPERFCESQLEVARFDRNGRRDAGYGAGGSGLGVRQDPFQRSEVAVGPDGRPVIATFDFQLPEQRIVLARLGPDGRLDPFFGVGGLTEVAGVAAGGGWPAVAVQSDGRVAVAAAGSGGGLVIARFLPSGAPDPSFGASGQAVASFGSLSQPANLLLGADGSIAVGLSSCCNPIFNKSSSVLFARFLNDGRLDPSFGGGAGWVAVPRSPPSRLTEIAAAPGGGVYALVEAERFHIERRTLALKLRADGRLDPRFGRGGEVSFGAAGRAPQVSAIAADARGRLIAAAGWRRGVLTRRLLPSGRRDRTFAGGGYARTVVPGGGANAAGMGLQASGRLVLLAETGAGEAKRFLLARLWAGNSGARCLGRRATIVGTRGRDHLKGTPRRDVIAALAGRDRVRGLGGNDLICGGRGRDRIFPGAGRDRVRP